MKGFKFKKVLSMIITISLLVGLFPASSLASGISGGDVIKGTNVRIDPDTTVNVTEFLKKMNNELVEIYGIDSKDLKFPEAIADGKYKARIYKVRGLSEGKWTDYGYIFAYGAPYGDTAKINYDGELVIVSRYIGRAGYTPDDPGSEFTNIAFPYDTKVTWTFPDLLEDGKAKSPMIPWPWENRKAQQEIYSQLGQKINKKADNIFYRQGSEAQKKIIDQIKLGIQLVHPELVGDPAKFNQIPWEKYVHIYQPPTYTAWGMGCIWHKDNSDGQIWYKTIPIAPYQLVESKYGIITLGFLDDGKVGTIDILESVDSKNQERLLKTISEDVVVQLSSFWEQFYRYMVSNYGKDPYNASDEEFDNAFDEFYDSYSEKDALTTAYDLFNQIFGGTIVDDLVFKYGIILGVLKAISPNGQLSEDALYLAKIYERDIFISTAQLLSSMSEDELRNVLNLLGPNLNILYKDPDVLYKGTKARIKDVYYSLSIDRVDRDTNLSEALKSQVGIANEIADRMLGADDLGLVFYSTADLGIEKGSKIPKSYFRNLANLYVKDVIGEMSNADVGLDSGKKELTIGSARRVAEKWADSNWSPKALEDLNNLQLYSIAYNTGLTYGFYDKNKGAFKTIVANESAISETFAKLAGMVASFGTSVRTYKVQKEDGSYDTLKFIPLKNKVGSIRWYNDDLLYGYNINRDLLANFGFDGFLDAPYIDTSNSDILTSMALAETASRTRVNINEDYNSGTMDISGTIAITMVGLHKAVPVDFYVVSKDSSGKAFILSKAEKYTYAVPQFIKGVTLLPEVSITNPLTKLPMSVKITGATIKPASIDIKTFLSKLDSAEAAGTDFIDVGNNRTYIKKAPFSGKAQLTDVMTGVAIEQDVKDKLLFSLTNDDAAAYKQNEQNRPAIVVYVEPGEAKGVVEVDVFEDANGNTVSVNFKNPVVNDGKVVLSQVKDASLLEWRLSNEAVEPFDETITWDKVKSVRAISSGGPNDTPVIKDMNGVYIIYVRYKYNLKDVNITGDLVLSQKRITKVFNLSQLGPLPNLTFTYPTAERHRLEDVDRSRTVDSSYKYVIGYSNNLNGLAVALKGDKFTPRFNGTNIKVGTAKWNGGASSITPNLYFMVWRGKDMPTLASYKEPANHPLLALGLKRGHVPQNDRNSAGGYQDSLTSDSNPLVLDKSGSGDYSTTFACLKCGDSRTQTHQLINKADYKVTVGIQSFIGSPNTGNAVPEDSTGGFTACGVTFNKAAGFAIPHSTMIKFYPYVQMGYDVFNESGDNAGYTTMGVDVLAQHVSAIKVNDYVEVGWYNPNPSMSLTINSNQWSTYVRAVQAFGKNSVLPGGALYSLTTSNSPTKVGVRTWQVYVPDGLRVYLVEGQEFSYDRASKADNDFAAQVKNTLDTLDVVQYVSNNPKADNAFGGVELLAKGGQNVYGNITSSYDKYWLRRGTNQNSTYANEADLDILDEDKSVIFYRVRSDTNGNVYVEKSTDWGNSWATLDTLSKTEGIGSLTSAEAKGVDARTKLITNFVAALDRNKGNDPSVSNGPGWYNEAWDGIYIMRVDRVFTIGFGSPKVRSVALDPKLTPPSAGIGDIFTRYYLSQFKVNEKSYIRADKPNGYLGSFGGRNVILPGMDMMFMSRKFLIPNATVMDLKY
jgi:hypothetical protein